MNAAVPLPIDVRLMNLTTALLVSSLLLACVAVSLWWVLRNPAFAIGQITVSGDTHHNTPASLRASVAPRLNGNFFTLDLAAVQAAFQSVPWIRRAVVRREFPDRLHVSLQEHVPVARWGEGESRMVNAFGEVFETGGADVDEASLPILAGPDEQAPQVLAMYQALNPMVRPLDTAIARLELEPRGHWHAELRSGTEIELGQGNAAELAARLGRFASTASVVAARHQRGADAIEAADLRHVGGYALRLHGVTTGRAMAPRGPR